MSPDATTLYLVMDLVRDATPASKFSDSAQYVFHTTSRAKFGDPPSPEVDVICVFAASQTIQCWAGTQEYVTGDASAVGGITSADGKLRVFAGLRDDPFFFNLAGFKETGKDVANAASSLTFDPAGCPQLDAATAGALVTQLQPAGGRTGRGQLRSLQRFVDCHRHRQVRPYQKRPHRRCLGQHEPAVKGGVHYDADTRHPCIDRLRYAGGIELRREQRHVDPTTTTSDQRRIRSTGWAGRGSIRP